MVKLCQQHRGSTPSAVFFSNWGAVCRNQPYPDSVVRLIPKMNIFLCYHRSPNFPKRMRHFQILGVREVIWTEFRTHHPQLRSDLRTNEALSAPRMCTHAEKKEWLARLTCPRFTVLFSVPDHLLLVAAPLWLCTFRLHTSQCLLCNLHK